MSHFCRRKFLQGTVGLAMASFLPFSEAEESRVIDAGPATQYAKDGRYDAWSERGFFLLRQGPQLRALSAYCTHRKFKLQEESDGSFRCPRHGSTFDAVGHCTQGPADQDLPFFPLVINAAGHVLVTVS